MGVIQYHVSYTLPGRWFPTGLAPYRRNFQQVTSQNRCFNWRSTSRTEKKGLNDLSLSGEINSFLHMYCGNFYFLVDILQTKFHFRCPLKWSCRMTFVLYINHSTPLINVHSLLYSLSDGRSDAAENASFRKQFIILSQRKLAFRHRSTRTWRHV